MTFKDKVIEIVRRIPEGGTLSYAEVAARAGSPKAARAVGNIMRSNYRPDVPCHRVIRSDGDAGEYNRGRDKKKALLRSEGARLSGN